MKRFVLAAIRFYQRYLSIWTISTCRFSPSCSEYMYQAINHYGIIHGLWLGVRRIIRCHPWSRGGFDPIPT